MKSIKFFLVVFLFGVLLIITLWPFVHGTFGLQEDELKDVVKSAQSIGHRLAEYFKSADSWNYLGIITLFSVLLIVFSLIDYFLRLLLPNKKDKWWFHFQWLLFKVFSFSITILIFIFGSYIVVYKIATPKIYQQGDLVRPASTLLVLGTRKYLDSHNVNKYYSNRIDQAIHFTKANGITTVIVSGDRKPGTDYDETKWMAQDLLRGGIPASIIVKDPSGFRTLDSIVRLKLKYGFTRVVIISQGFHLQRALFLAWFYNIDATGVVAQGGVTGKMAIRELLAKPKLLLDVFIFNTQPKFGHTETRRSWGSNSDDYVLLVLDLAFAFIALLIGYSLFE